MSLIDRLRPRWRHPDPDVRAAAVRELDRETGHDRERLAEIARTDPDARVRRLAVKRLDDADVLAQAAARDPDTGLRELAAERARAVLVATAVSSEPLATCEAALARLDEERSIATVASTAAHEAVRHAALARVAGERALRDVVRGATDAAIRRAALGRIHDADLLRGIAVAEGHAELALEAVARVDDADTLRAIAEHRGAAQAVRQRARDRLGAGSAPLTVDAKAARARQLELSTLVHALRADPDLRHAAARVRDAEDEWEELKSRVEPRADVAERFAAARDAVLGDAALLARREAAVEGARSAIEDGVAARLALCEQVERLDGPGALDELARARRVWGRLVPLGDPREGELARRFAAAADACSTRHERLLAGDALRSGLGALVEEAEALAAAPQVPKHKVWHALERRWGGVQPAPAGAGPEIDQLRDRFAAAGARLQQRWQEAGQQQAERQQENLRRLEALCARLGELAQADLRKPAAARRQLEAADAALADLGPLPAAERRAAWTERLTDARAAVLRRLREVEETEEWRRWANAAAQEEIIGRVEALLESGDLAEGSRQLGRLQQDWEQVATATPEKSRVLWERFRALRTELRKRCDVYLAANLEKKRALVEQVAGLGEPTSWNETAELIKRVQAEWKEIGPVPAQHAQAIWRRFREPCDRFFARRKEHFDRVDHERNANAERKRALCERAEALADSTDWDTTAAAVKQLQGEWKQIGPAPRAESEALWQRFRSACDRFFDRHRRRDELARDAAVAEAAALCDAMDALGESIAGDRAGTPADAAQRIDELWGAWLRLDPPTLGDATGLDQRMRAACDRIATARPECLSGTRLDPEATRKGREKLCKRLDDLVDRLSDTPRALSVQEMALALRDRLASNTIAGPARAGSARQDAAPEIERIDAAWARLGPVVGEAARALAMRFDAARARARDALGARTSAAQ